MQYVKKNIRGSKQIQLRNLFVYRKIKTQTSEESVDQTTFDN